MSQPASVGVVVLDSGQPALTARCLESLASGSRLPTIVVLVENGGPTGLAPDDYPFTVRVVAPERNLGCAGGRNAGIRDLLAVESDVDRMMILDNDAIVRSDTLRCAATVELGRLDVIAPVITLADGSLWSTGGALDERRNVRLRTDRLGAEQTRPVPWAPGACLLFGRETWRIVGEFDAWMNFLFEDVEWCERVSRLGGMVRVDATFRVQHLPHQSLGGGWSRRRLRYWVRNRLVFQAAPGGRYLFAALSSIAQEIALAGRDVRKGYPGWAALRLAAVAEAVCCSVTRLGRHGVARVSKAANSLQQAVQVGLELVEQKPTDIVERP